MLTGIKIIDFTMLLPGPYATMRLADLGAEVMKVEPPNGGDPARHTGPQIDDIGVVYLANNRDKTSLRIDLKTESGQAEALALILSADVIIEGFRPGVMQKFGLHYDNVAKHKPNIIYCSLTGYGQTGPLSHLAGHDLNYIAQSGVLSQFSDATSRLILPTVQLADMVGGMAASEAILAALVKRERTGDGSYLDIALTDTLTGLLTHHALVAQINGDERGLPELAGTLVCYQLYETNDHRFVSFAPLEPKFWHNFCMAIGHADWLSLQFSPARDGETFYEELKQLFRSRTLTEWRQFGDQVDGCLRPVLNVSEVLVDDHVRARNGIISTENQYVHINTQAGGYRPS